MSETVPTILVVDDNDAERYYVARVLRRAGFETSEAATGSEALRLAAEGPALITLDVRLPDLSGFEVCRKLKASVATRDIPVLHISASFTTPESKAEGLDGGADGYLTHPVDPMELVATVRALLRVQQAEERARAAAREWTTTFDAIGDAVCLTGRDGAVVRCNHAFARLLGLPYGRIIGRGLSELVPSVAGADPEEVSFNDRVYRVSRRPADAPGHPGSQAWVFGDITDRRRAEAQLEQAQRLEAVGRLAGGVAHETNNQMTVVLGCANYALRQRGLPDSVREDLEQIRKAAERTAGITAQLLAFGRRQMVRPEVVRLNRVVARLRPILERALGESSALILELAPELPPVSADVGQLEQVLLNLVLNARDAMPGGGSVTIRVSEVVVDAEPAGPDVPPGRYAVLSVRDTGSGMDEATLRQAFEPFFTTKGVGKGTGLGLSMVYGIVRQSAGHIRAISAPGSGTTFDIYLPVLDAAEPSSSEASDTPSRARRTILLVEDDSGVRSILSRELAASGHVVLEAPDGRAALALVRQWGSRLDAVITDCRMPEMDGHELAREVAVLQPGLRVLFTSGHPDAEAVRGLARDGRHFIQKPFTAEELSRFIDRALEER